MFEAAVEQAVSENQSAFADDLIEPLRKAASAVIYGNFMGEGAYSPRPIGKFSSSRSRYYRGWVQTNYGSQRARLAGGKKAQAEAEQPKHSLDHLRNTVLVSTITDLAKTNPAYSKIAQDAVQQKPSDSLKGFLASPLGQRMIQRSQKNSVQPRGEMRYGVQTGKLAKSWRDLRVVARPGKLSFELIPTMGSTTGTPDALKLAAYLTGPKSAGLMDHDQLVLALRDQGILSR
ncbi:hypothetical protein [Deinococcus xinjiangensis]|uniref:hypothetical protein n=1 Tax=Deinococcus xinjiangensis TaxID=457454 RepID=UPI0033655274